MDAFLQQEVFSDFGADRLMPYELPRTARLSGGSSEGLRELIRQKSPREPGVYGMIDAVGRLIYVGKSKSLRNRLLSYFMPTNEDEKGGRIIQSAEEIVWEAQPTEFAALLREQHLIRNFRPRFNVQGIPNRQKSVFLCLGRGPVETFYVSRDVDSNAIAWEGPFVGSNRVHRAVEILNRFFQLRDCPNQTKFQFTDQRPLFELEIRPECMRHELATCLGPCAMACSRRSYQRQVDLAVSFLKGTSHNIVEHLESQMALASRRLHFEQAVRYREDAQILRWLTLRLAYHAQAREKLTCIYPMPGNDDRDIWYLIRRGVVEHAVRAPKKSRDFRTARDQVEHWSKCDNTLGVHFQRREETLAIVSGWFRKNPAEQKRIRLLHEIDAKPLQVYS
ncbi:MAG: GIY-YIG nuclease family protein [Pirellulaceae bacterium]|nr:GIY-YIG nuclease family protein [Pirellulaceae bacterium]